MWRGRESMVRCEHRSREYRPLSSALGTSSLKSPRDTESGAYRLSGIGIAPLEPACPPCMGEGENWLAGPMRALRETQGRRSECIRDAIPALACSCGDRIHDFSCIPTHYGNFLDLGLLSGHKPIFLYPWGWGENNVYS